MNSLTAYHISSSFIDDSFCRKCQSHQQREFLCGGVAPRVGQRVELLLFLKRRGEDGRPPRDETQETWEAGNMENKIRPFRLSGEIVEVKDRPRLDTPPQEPAHHQQRRTRSQTRRISLDDEPPSTPRLRPSTSSSDSGLHRGSLFLADIVRNSIPGRVRLTHMAEPTPEMLLHWEEMSMERRERICDSIVATWGAVHGQEIVCEARLNFDYDMRRGREEGPWSDLIPVDGRDIWRFTLAYNDQYDDDCWHAISDSFENLGPNHRNRCWPWTNDHALPYRRTGADAPVWGNGPGGALQVHVDLGPFHEKNVGRKRPNLLGAFAA